MYRLTTFGGLALSKDGAPLTGAPAQRSRLALLAVLATAGPTGFSRDKLLLHLWPESDEERARHALKQAVYSLRRELGADEVIVGTASLSLNPLFITSDVREFEAALAAGDDATAASLYTGPFLDGVHLKDSAEFDRWSSEQRAKYAHSWVCAVERLAADCESRGAWRDAAGRWRTLVSAEPLSGRHTLALVRSLAESGDLGAALQQYRIHETLLREEMGTAPEPAVSSFAEALRAGTWTRSPERPPVKATPVATAEPAAPAIAASSSAAPVDVVGAPAGQPVATARTRGSITPARRRRRRSTAIAFILGMLLVAAGALTVSYARMDPDKRAAIKAFRSRDPATLVPRRIVVAPFDNQTGDSTLDALGEQIADWFARELGEAEFDVVDARTALIGSKVVGAIPKFLRASDRAVQLGEDTRAAYAVVGKLFRDGDSLEANVTVIDVATRRLQKSLGPYHGSRAKADVFILRLLKPTVAYLGAAVDTSAGALTAKYTSPPSLEAFERVSRAWEKFFASPRDTASVFAALDSAAALDTMYATPLLMKGYIYDVKANWPPLNDAMPKIRARAARMSRLEKASLELLEADLRGDALSRYAIARRIKEASPGSGEMPILMAVTSLYTGRVKDALAAIDEADPNRGMNLATPTYWEWRGLTLHYAERYSEEEKAVKIGLERFRHHPSETFALVRVLAQKNDPEIRNVVARGVPPGRREPDSPVDRDGERVDLGLYAGRELRAHGHEREASQMFADIARELATLPATATRVQKRRQAHAFYEAKDYQRARDAFAALAASDSFDTEALGRQATASIHLGDTVTARRIDARLAAMKLPFPMGRTFRWRASIAAAEGRQADAYSLLQSAVRQGDRLMDTQNTLTVHHDQDYLPLTKLSGFKQMLQELASAQAR